MSVDRQTINYTRLEVWGASRPRLLAVAFGHRALLSSGGGGGGGGGGGVVNLADGGRSTEDGARRTDNWFSKGLIKQNFPAVIPTSRLEHIKKQKIMTKSILKKELAQ